MRGGQRSYRGSHDAEERGLERRDPDDPGHSAGRDRRQLSLGGLNALQQRRGMPHQDLSRRGQADVTSDPLQQ
jgi:hypothetical protein